MCRETASVWFYLRNSGKQFGYFFWLRFFKRKMWTHPYFWQDTVLTHFNRLMGCKVLGHRRVEHLLMGCANDGEHDFCFDCCREVEK